MSEATPSKEEQQRLLLLQYRYGMPTMVIDSHQALLDLLKTCVNADPDSLEGLLAQFLILDSYIDQPEVISTVQLDFDLLLARLDEENWAEDPYLWVVTYCHKKEDFISLIAWRRELLNIMELKQLSYSEARRLIGRPLPGATVRLFKPSPAIDFLMWVRLGFPSVYVEPIE